MKKLLTILILMFLLLTLSGCYSCQSWHRLWGTGPVEPSCAHKFFFDKDCKRVAKAPPVVRHTSAKPAVKPKPAPKPVKKATPPPAVNACGESVISKNYPSRDCAVIVLNKNMPNEVDLHAVFDYTIKVTNTTDMTVNNVVVTESIPGNFAVKKATKGASKDGNRLVWKLGSFAPRQSIQITIRGVATDTECIKTCSTVTYEIPVCAAIRVVEPKLQLKKTAPAEVLLCDPIPVKFIVTNPGTGSTRDVTIEDNLPAGLKTTDGRRSLVFNAGTLKAGQSRQFSATLQASKTGVYVNKAVATSSSGLRAEAETTTIVRKPVLKISKVGPKKRYLGRSVTYQIQITNKGDAPASDLVIEDQLPAGVKFVSATDGGKAAAGKVSWNLGTLGVGKSRKLSVTVMPNKAGVIMNSVTATSPCTEGVRASAKTTVAGIPAILLEVVDVDDPVEIGGQTTYLITATNQGTTDGTNIRIVCGLEANEQYVSSSGATNGTITGSTITFAPLRSLAPKAKASWRVLVKAAIPGDVRFKATMNTDQLTRPVEETEATYLYE